MGKGLSVSEWILIAGLFAISVWVIPSCGFKKPKTELPSLHSQLSVSWTNSKGEGSPSIERELTISRVDRKMIALSAITLPETVPDSIHVEVAIPRELSLPATVAGIRVVQPGGASGSLRVLNSKSGPQGDSGSSLICELTGLRGVLSDHKEDEVQVELEVSGQDGKPISVGLRLRTPPSLVRLTPLVVSDWEGGLTLKGVSAQGAKSFSLHGRDFYLLAVYEAANLSSHPIELTLPVESSASVKRYFTVRSREKVGECGNAGQVQSKGKPLSGRGLELLLDESLPLELVALESDADAKPQAKAQILPGASVHIGVFGEAISREEGEELKALSLGHYEMRKASQVELPDHCESVCPKMRMGPSEFPLCWTANVNRFGVSAAQVKDCLDCGSGSKDACERCSSWEEKVAAYKQAGPNCLFCGELAVVGQFGEVKVYQAIPEWQHKPVMESFQVGIEDKALVLEADPSLSAVAVRYTDLKQELDPEARSLPFISAAQVLAGYKDGESPGHGNTSPRSEAIQP